MFQEKNNITADEFDNTNYNTNRFIHDAKNINRKLLIKK